MTQPGSFSHQGRTLFILALIAAACFSTAYTQSTEFNYQGRLANPPGTPANGTYDFQFTLTDALNGGSVIAVVPRLNVTVSNGVFNTSIDFGSTPFDGSNRYLEIAVRPAGAGGFTTLLPRQQILSTPYAIKSLNADNAAKLAGVDSTRYVQQDAGGNVSIGGGLTVAGSLSLNTVNAQTEYDLGGQRVLSIVNGSSGNPSLSLGTGAGDPNTSPFSTFLGQFAGQRNTGFANTFVGSQSGNANTTGSGNSFLGASSGYANTTGNGNSFFGQNAGRNNTTAFSNTFVGSGAGAGSCSTEPPCPIPLTGALNSFFGTASGQETTSGFNNAFLGAVAGQKNTTGYYNAFVGAQAGQSNTTGFENSFFGSGAGLNNTTGQDNVFAGKNAGILNTTGGFNTFVGAAAGTNNLTGSSNTIVGYFAGLNNNGSGNTFFGASTGQSTTSGSSNAFFGIGAGQSNKDGNYNGFFGNYAGFGNSSGTANNFVGGSAGYGNTTGSNNTFLGDVAGFTNTTGSNNTIIGDQANVASGNLSNATAVGAGASVSQSDSLVLGNNANVGIGTSAPQAKLNVVGTSWFQGDTTGLPSAAGRGIAIGFPGAATAGYLFAFDYGSFAPMNLLLNHPGGNVGIGTTTPTSKLTVGGLIETTAGGIKFPDGTIQTTASSGGAAGVSSLNALTGSVTIAAGSNITVTPSGNTLTIASTAAGGNFINNQTAVQSGANFNIDATGKANIFDAATQYNMGGSRFASSLGTCSLWIGKSAGGALPAPGDADDCNTFVGTSAGTVNAGASNAFVGSYAGSANNFGSQNTFIGYLSGAGNTDGTNNTFVGANNSGNTTGANNTFIGVAAGASNKTGNNNTVVGTGANVGANNLGHATAIGSDSIVATSNTVVLGRNLDTVQVPGNLIVSGTFSNPSDVRLKQNIERLPYGLRELMRLRPVTWRWKAQPSGRRLIGMIAQEVEPIMPELVERPADDKQPLTMNYLGFVPVVIKAVQEQQAEIKSQAERIKQQQDQIDSLKRLVCQDHPHALACRR